LKLNHDELLSNFAFNLNLRHYIEGAAIVVVDEAHEIRNQKGRVVQVDPSLTPA